jgi:competence protein ComEA
VGNIESEHPAATPDSPAPSPDLTPAPDTALTLTRRDRLFLSGCALVILALMTLRIVSLRLLRPPEVEVLRSPENTLAMRVEINSATWVEWMQLEGIGETTARNIVADREKRGPFQNVEDVSRVRGIGDAKLAAMRPYLQCSDCDK